MDHREECGSVSAIGLCVLTAVLLLALAAAQFMRGGASVAAEYEREMQLRLAAESGVETAAASLERDADAYGPLPPVGRSKIVSTDLVSIPTSEGIKLCVFIERPEEAWAEKGLTVGAAAIDSSETGIRIPDGEKWERAKIVRGWMEKKGNRYVWRRWY